VAAVFVRKAASREATWRAGAGKQNMSTQPTAISLGAGEENELSLVEILDHVLNSGVVLQGSLVISLAGVDLLYVALQAVVTSVETALSARDEPGRRNK
jgi:hypothetical protein